MAVDLFIEKLNLFKRNEKPEAVLMISDNPEFIKIIVAWSNLDVKYAGDIKGSPGESEQETWKWLWSNTSFSISELKEKLGTSLSVPALKDKIKPLIGNRVIYPDGSVNSFVERYLREQVVSLFETKSKKSGRKV